MLVQEEMQWLLNVLKLLDAKDTANDVMYARQRMFEHRAKPAFMLATVGIACSFLLTTPLPLSTAV